MKRILTLITLTVLFSITTQNTNALPTVYYVDASKVTGLNNGSSWMDAYLTIQSALDVSVSGDQIWVAAATYYPTKEVGGAGVRYRTFELKSGISVYGGFAGTETSLGQRNVLSNTTILSGDIGLAVADWNNFASAGWNDNVQHVISAISTGTLWALPAIIDGFTVKGGYASGAGSNYGGGIYMLNGGYVELYNNRFEYNYAGTFGGAICIYQGSKTKIDNCIVTKNHGVSEVGGIWNEWNCTAEVSNCEISYNTTVNNVSGMLNLGNSNCTVSNCVFKYNTSAALGAFCNYNTSTAVLNNCLFYNNNCSSNMGGGISNMSSTLTANNVTVVNNFCPTGGGIYNSGTCTLNNSIVWGNTGTTGKQILNSSSLTLNYSCYSNGSNDVSGTITAINNNITTDPLFVSATGYDFRIYGNSPCADAGNDIYNTQLYDIRGAGYDRKLNKSTGTLGTIDMGAYEFKYGTDPLCYGVNPNNGGTITANQALCPGSIPAQLDNSILPSGHTGTLEYQWQMSTTGSGSGFTNISGANSIFFQPAALSVTTWFKRLSKVNCFYDYSGAAESNVIEITMNPEYAFTETQTICTGDSLLWQGAYRKTAGVHNANYTSVNSCDSTYALTLNLNPTYTFTETQAICSGDSLLWQGVYRKTAGTHTANYTTVNSCDSTYALTLNLNPTYTFTETQAICSGDSLLWQGVYRKTAGVHNANYTTLNSCDSTYALTLNLNPVYAFAETQAICNGDSLLWQGLYRKTAGVHTANYLTTLNCDSTYTLNFTVNPLPLVSITNLDTFYCLLDAPFMLTGNPSGGTFTGDGLLFGLFSPTVAGVGAHLYTYEYTDGNGCTNTDSVSVNIQDCLGMETNSEVKLSLYPNPTAGAFMLQLDESASIEIYSAQGSLVYAEKFERGKHDLKLNVAEGVYLLKAANDKGFVNHRIVIQK
ncbi:MAG: T9SS type A sorting domain-containing protein [Bacteroidota bacterium]